MNTALCIHEGGYILREGKLQPGKVIILNEHDRAEMYMWSSGRLFFWVYEIYYVIYKLILDSSIKHIKMSSMHEVLVNKILKKIYALILGKNI